jgi:hypothetical protein
MIEELLQGLESGKPRVRYAAAKALRQCSEQDPARLYPHIDRFIALTEGDNTFLRWGSQRILGNLAAADCDHKLEAALGRILAPISGHELIGAANAIAAAARIACANPKLADRIATALLKTDRAEYATPECRNVAIGHALRALDRFFPNVRNRRHVLSFARKQLDNSRPATRKHAERFLKHWSNQPIGHCNPKSAIGGIGC